MIFFSMEYNVNCLQKSSCFEFFRRWKIRSFLGPKIRSKYDIYWLLKNSCFELFGNGKYGLFWDKKLMERSYLLITEKFLFWTFRWWEIRSFFHPQSWWKDDVYLVFFTFPWYSRIWEIWFFVQCAQLSSDISNLIAELIAIRNLTCVRFYNVWFSREIVCLHLLHIEKDWLEFSTVRKSFNKSGPLGPSFQTIFLFLMTMVFQKLWWKQEINVINVKKI